MGEVGEEHSIWNSFWSEDEGRCQNGAAGSPAPCASSGRRGARLYSTDHAQQLREKLGTLPECIDRDASASDRTMPPQPAAYPDEERPMPPGGATVFGSMFSSMFMPGPREADMPQSTRERAGLRRRMESRRQRRPSASTVSETTPSERLEEDGPGRRRDFGLNRRLERRRQRKGVGVEASSDQDHFGPWEEHNVWDDIRKSVYNVWQLIDADGPWEEHNIWGDEDDPVRFQARQIELEEATKERVRADAFGCRRRRQRRQRPRSTKGLPAEASSRQPSPAEKLGEELGGTGSSSSKTKSGPQPEPSEPNAREGFDEGSCAATACGLILPPAVLPPAGAGTSRLELVRRMRRRTDARALKDDAEDAAERITGETERKLTFSPGPIGMRAEMATGLITKVNPDGQAEKLGVKAGWMFVQIDGQPYSEALLDAKLASGSSYVVTFSGGSQVRAAAAPLFAEEAEMRDVTMISQLAPPVSTQQQGDGDDVIDVIVRTQSRRRGNAALVRSASMNDKNETYILDHRRAREKGEATRRFIMASMKQHRICAVLEESDLERMVDTMDYFEFRKGQIILQEGRIGSTFFVTQQGALGVSVNGTACNTMARGRAFGGLALLCKCPRVATVRALEDCGLWGASGENFQKVLAEAASKNYAENRQMIDNIRLFDGLPDKIKDNIADCIFNEVVEPGHRLVTAGESVSAIYIVKKGELQTYLGGTVSSSGEFSGGDALESLHPGDCLGEQALVKGEERASATAFTRSRCELLCISVGDLRDMLGNGVAACLEHNFLLLGLKKSPLLSQFSSSQLHEIARAAAIKNYAPGGRLEGGLRFVIVIDGMLTGNRISQKAVTLERGEWDEDNAVTTPDKALCRTESNHDACDLESLTAGPKGARVGVLSKSGMASALTELGLAKLGSSSIEEASDYMRKMVMAKKIHIFRHLAQEQMDNLVKAFQLQRYRKGAHVIKQGELGSSFFVIASGEVVVFIDGSNVRTMGKNSYFGERALLFAEKRSATVEVSSNEAELWSIEESIFSQIMSGKMQQNLIDHIRLQDSSVRLEGLQPVKVIGAGAEGVVRLVQHKTTGARYALKRAMKQNGQIPDQVKHECDLLAENDHPFIMALVKCFETKTRVYMLTELITGGELHAAIRQIPTVLSRAQAQFYTGSLVIVLEELSDKNIVYRDLKPENVMLDAQGYLKLIDFGIAKRLQEGKNRTFTMVGTPHYMAPEVMRGRGYSTEVDLWSLGVMHFEFVCGRLPFADDSDDPTEVCTAVLKDTLSIPKGYKDQHGKELMQGMLTRQPKKRLGASIHGFEEIKNHTFFKAGHTQSSLFNKIMGRELEPPVTPSGETYCDPDEVEASLSDEDELRAEWASETSAAVAHRQSKRRGVRLSVTVPPAEEAGEELPAKAPSAADEPFRSEATPPEVPLQEVTAAASSAESVQRSREPTPPAEAPQAGEPLQKETLKEEAAVPRSAKSQKSAGYDAVSERSLEEPDSEPD